MNPNIRYPLLLDGGLSNELESQGCKLNHELWTAKLLVSDPEKIGNAHLAYLKAGAQCLITSSYQLSKAGISSLNGKHVDLADFLLRAVALATRAVEHYLLVNPTEKRPLIAASIGPYGAHLADGSEYRGNYGVSDKELSDFHHQRIQVLDQSAADILACETIPSFQEARVLAKALKHSNKKAWISFSCKDGQHLNDGTPIKECAEFLNEHPTVFAIGVNCTHPQYISELIHEIKSTCGDKKIVVYPNYGSKYDSKSKTWSGDSTTQFNEYHVKEWLQNGADIIGGCCQVGPSQIKEVASIFNDY